MKEEKIYMTSKGKDEFRAGDIEDHTNVFSVTNPVLLICRMDPSVNLEFEFTVTKGRGYVPAEENMPKDAPIGVITVDAIYTTIKNVLFCIYITRVGLLSDYDNMHIAI